MQNLLYKIGKALLYVGLFLIFDHLIYDYILS